MPARLILCALLLWTILPTSAQNWQNLGPYTGSAPCETHEAAFVEVNGKGYLFPGRESGSCNITIFDPSDNTWTEGPEMTRQIHHVQPVVIGTKIYLIGGFEGGFPDETPVDSVYIFETANNTWSAGPEIPVARRRGSAGAVLYNGKIYVVCGIQNGHEDGHVAWLDEFDPTTGTFTTLSDAPQARDHFQAAVIGDELVVIAGRRTNANGPNGIHQDPVVDVEKYNFTSGTWSQLGDASDMPLERAGTFVVVTGDSVIVMGGESRNQKVAHSEVAAFRTSSDTWAEMDSMSAGRHGTGAFLLDNVIYTAAGARERGSTLLELTSASFAESYVIPTAPQNQPPTAAFSVSASSGTAPLTVNFDASASSDSDGTIAAYIWDFGTGDSATGVTTSFTYTTAGTYNAVLAVVDDASDTSRTTQTITVQEVVIGTDVWLEAECGTVGQNWRIVQDVSASDQKYVVFPDGRSLNEAPTDEVDIITYTFQVSEGATYKIFARALIPNSDDDSFWFKIDDTDWVKWNRATPGTVFDWYEVTNDDLSNDPPVTYSLSEGSHTLSISYREDGALLDKIYITKDGTLPTGAGGTANNCTTPANLNPLAAFTLNPSTGTAPLDITLDASNSSDLDGTIVKYKWEFGDGESDSSGQIVEHLYFLGQEYTTTLTVTDDGGRIGIQTFTFTLAEPDNYPPRAEVTTSILEGPAPLTVDFDASNSEDIDGNITSYDWEFGDGTDDNGATVSHTYTTSGIYTATVTITDNDDAETVETFTVRVNALPVASFTVNPTTPVTSLVTQFDASATVDPDGVVVSHTWDFGDGGTATGEIVEYTYTSFGTFDVQLIAVDDAGSADTAVVSVTVNGKPTSAFTLNPTSGQAPLQVSVDGSTSADADGTIVSYAWDFGDGETATGVSASNLFDEEGTFIVSLIVSDNLGATDTSTTTITISAAPNIAPTAAFSVTPDTGAAPITITFNATSSTDSDGTVASYDWDFGDGNTGTGQITTHSYANGGTLTVQLVITDDDGATDTATFTLTLTQSPNELPTASFTANNQLDTLQGSAPFNVLFNASSSADPDGSIASYLWDFGDDTEGSGILVQHQYANQGTFLAILTVTDNRGQTATDTLVVVVSGTVGIADDLTTLDVFYPNPLTDSRELTIGYSLKKAGRVTYEIRNYLGQQVWTTQRMVGAGNIQEVFDLPRIAPGAYIFILRAPEGNKGQKFLVAE
ncbi:MAG: PKD domain-containing protein [Bacteroidota bacterium]